MDLFKIPSNERQEILERLRKEYPKGTLVELVSMDDPHRIMPAKLKGTVNSVDDAGTIHVSWENGSSLGVVYQVDVIRKLK